MGRGIPDQREDVVLLPSFPEDGFPGPESFEEEHEKPGVPSLRIPYTVSAARSGKRVINQNEPGSNVWMAISKSF
jgi:hypothetical protein